MIHSVGVDIAEVGRIRAAMDRWGDRFLDRTFSEEERVYCLRHRDAALRLAARFAAKEAFIKCLGTSRGVRWKEIELVNAPSGKPSFRLSESLRRSLERKKIRRVHVSVSHTKDHAVAMVVFESDGPA